MVAIIHKGQTGDYLIESLFILHAQGFYFGSKRIYQFIFGDTAKGGIRRLHADIVQLVQIAEDADLGKLGDSGQKNKTQIAVGTFQHSIKSFQRTAVFRQ